ncbi:MAG TPA: FISUMP domain-containing protein, partial [Polyangiaceae bacterium]|nr:FISUMP domain-containing protein [Polyangiaceae bacterium]
MRSIKRHVPWISRLVFALVLACEPPGASPSVMGSAELPANTRSAALTLTAVVPQGDWKLWIEFQGSSEISVHPGSAPIHALESDCSDWCGTGSYALSCPGGKCRFELDVVARPDTTEQAQVSAEIPYADESEGCGRDPHYVPPEDVARLFQITFEVRDVVHASLDAGAAASPATDAARAQDADRPRSTPEAGAERSGDATSEGGSVSDAGATQIDGPLVTARGSLLDARDGRRYATVTLGRQTWMAESLDYGPQQRGIQASVVPTDDSSVEKYCVDDDPEQCQRVGGLYSWPEALALPAACVETLCLGRTVEVHQGICPQGWHVPSFVEWSELALYLAGRLG